uniref:Uncharacterized protein n=1 Tax=Tanacetum cinerariifolium TaxID=118510 RepID=A0A6L2L783_TANCI|nr:hypothetical protein [Tanacetum cinerariifolium]
MSRVPKVGVPKMARYEVRIFIKKDKNKAKRTKPGTGMKRARKIKAEGKFILNLIPLILSALKSLKSITPLVLINYTVVADNARCSEIGASVLRAGGHAVDVAVSVALCSYKSQNMYQNNLDEKYFRALSMGVPGGFVEKFVRDPNKISDSSQRPPHDCLKCENPVDGLHCRKCALLRKKLKEVWFTICDEQKFFQDFLNTFESSNDNTNVVNAPQETFVLNLDPGKKSSQSPRHIDHHCCYGCGDSLDDIFCQQCTCESCGNGAHYGYNCPPKVPIPIYYNDDDEESYTPLRDIIIYELPPCIAITPVLSTKETKDSLIMRDEHLDTIPKKESDEFIKYSVENLVPNPSNFSSSDDKLFSDEDVPKEIYSNPLIDEEIISIKIDLHHFNAESDLIESLINQDSSIISSSKIDSLLDELAGELIFLKSIPLGIDEADCDPEEEIRLIEKLFYDNSSPRPPEEINSENSDVVTKSFSLSPIPVENSDLFMEEINLFLTSDGSIPLGIDSDYSNSEGDNLFPERLLHDDPIPFPDILDSSNVVRIFPPFFTYPVTSSILLFSGSEDTIFDPGISDYHFSSFMPGVSHRSGTFMKFNVYPNHLNESPMEILSFTCSLMEQCIRGQVRLKTRLTKISASWEATHAYPSSSINE